jgi:tetratricopeptide (TPR) repeat protein
MEEMPFKEAIRSFNEDLRMSEVKEALDDMKSDLIPQCADGLLREEALTLHDSYYLMLESLARYPDDPNRHRMYEQMRKWGQEVSVRFEFEYNKRHPSSGFYLKYRAREGKNFYATYADALQQLEALHTERKLLSPRDPDYETEIYAVLCRQDDALTSLFEDILFSCLWTEAEAHDVHDLLQSPILSENELCVTVSAITLSLYHHFDERKYLQLIELCSHTSMQVSQRALVGLCITVPKCYQELYYLTTTWNVMDMLSEVPNIRQRLLVIQKEFIHAKNATKVAEKMESHIIPIMMDPSLNAFPTDEDGEPAEGPSFRRIFGTDDQPSAPDENMKDKLKLIQQFQRDGEDIYYCSFSRLKSEGFFIEPAQWLYLFDAENRFARRAFSLFHGKEGETMRYFLESVVLCNSDKYSFLFALGHMNQSQISQFMQQLNEQRDAVMDNVTFHNSTRRRADSMEDITRQYVQDLNRFCTLSVEWKNLGPLDNKDIKDWKTDYFESDDFDPDNFDRVDFCTREDYLDGTDLFFEPLFWRCPVFRNLMGPLDFVPGLIGQLRQWDCYELAARCYYTLSVEHLYLYECMRWRIEDSIRIGLKKNKFGWTAQLLEKYQDMLDQDMTMSEEALKEHILWMAKCILKLKRKCSDIDFMGIHELILKYEPDNIKLIVALAKDLINSLNYEEALPYLYKWAYAADDPAEPYRTLVWALINCDHLDEAYSYSQKVLSHYTPIFNDWINAGHIALLKGDLKTALENYRRAIPLFDDKNNYPMEATLDEIFEEAQGKDMTIDFMLAVDIIGIEAEKYLKEKEEREEADDPDDTESE